MLETFTLLLHRHPTLFRAMGIALYKLACLGLISGAFAEISKVASSVTNGLSGHAATSELAHLFPGVWTWWIPETFAGMAFYVLACGMGATLAMASKNAQRQLRYL
jgi:hypothetical protein